MVMSRRDLVPEGHSYLGSVTRAATEFNQLCYGQMDRMVTDTRTLLTEGLKTCNQDIRGRPRSSRLGRR